jgi:hypothetical protein
MPHDCKGRQLKPGDKVLLEGTVEQIFEGQETCNVIVRPLHARPEGDWPVTLNAHWVEKQEDRAPMPGAAREAWMGDVAS